VARTFRVQSAPARIQDAGIDSGSSDRVLAVTRLACFEETLGLAPMDPTN
jgi:hypothetical protein